MSQQVADVPKVPFELFIVLAGCRADDLAPRDQIDARLVGPVSAADAELNVRTTDGEFRRRQRAHRIVAMQVSIHEPLSAITADLLLVGQSAVRGAIAKRSACRAPFAVRVALEIGEDFRLADFAGSR